MPASKPSKRTLQIAEQIKNHIATLCTTGRIADPRIQKVTLTRARVTPDLQQAEIYYSILGSESERLAAAKGFAAASGFLRNSVSTALQLRYTPALKFVFDQGIAHAARISEMLADVLPSQTQLQPRGNNLDQDAVQASETSAPQ
jgi:ribosome-binding factor A